MMSFYGLSVGVRKVFGIFRGRMLFKVERGIIKYYLMNWETICFPEYLTGLVVLILNLMNINLLCNSYEDLKMRTGLVSRQQLRKKNIFRRKPCLGPMIGKVYHIFC